MNALQRLRKIFARRQTSSQHSSSSRQRLSRFERLESRELLSASTAFNAAWLQRVSVSASTTVSSAAAKVATPLVALPPVIPVVTSFTANGGATAQITYRILTAGSGTGSIAFYRSAGPRTAPGDVYLASLPLTRAQDLTVGAHTITITLGADAGDIPLPGAGAATVASEYWIVAVTSGLSVPMSGVYHVPGQGVYVQGTLLADSCAVTGGSTISIGLGSGGYCYAQTDVTGIDVRLHGNADQLAVCSGLAVGAGTLPIVAYAGSGVNTLSLTDNLGDFSVTLSPASTSATGTGYTVAASGFAKVQVKGLGGGFNSADLTGGANPNNFAAIAAGVSLVSGNASLSVAGFQQVVVHQIRATDRITITSTGGYQLLEDGWNSGYKFTGMNFNDPRLVALRQWELPAIYAAYGLTTDSSDLARADAIRDWVARTAVHPDTNLHFNGSTSNLSVLPAGKTWTDVNSLITAARATADSNYWAQFNYDGYAMLNALLGVLDPNSGVRDGTGAMQLVAPGEYRIKDLSKYRFSQCTWEASMLEVLWAAAGLNSVMIASAAHNPTAVYIPSLQQWIWDDADFDERLTINGQPATPRALLNACIAGGASYAAITPVKQLGPSWDPTYYAVGYTYFPTWHAPLTTYMRVALNSNLLGGTRALNVVEMPGSVNDPSAQNYTMVSDAVSFPYLG